VSWTLDNTWDPSDAHFEHFLGRKAPKREQPENPICRLMTFIVGDAADFWTAGKTKADRAKAVIDHLQRAYKFRDDELFDETDRNANYIEENWLDVSELGVPSPAAMMPKETLSQFGEALRTPIGRVHWAGSETALEWCGYMDGAVESGFRAARDVAALIERGSVEGAASEPRESAERFVRESA